MDVISRTCAQLKTIDLSGSTCLTEEDILKLSNLRTTLRQIIDLWHFPYIQFPFKKLKDLVDFGKETYPFCFLLIVSRKPTLSVAVIMLLMHR